MSDKDNECIFEPEETLDLSGLSSKDFDGHTSFSSMSAEERLLWLSQAAAFLHEVRGCRLRDKQ